MESELKTRGCKLIPNVAALNLHSYNSDEYGYVKAPTREQARDILADYLTSDVFVLSANAITMEGEIINVDGVGNRGPAQEVLFLAGEIRPAPEVQHIVPCPIPGPLAIAQNFGCWHQ